MRLKMDPETIKEKIEREGRAIKVEDFDIENGGIYLELTEDSRGWMLGDKTRKMYKTTLAQVMLTTGLIVVATPKKEKLIVRVCNHKDVSRMLLSKNDDVGSSIQYADISDPSGTELIAQSGNHVCIESITNGSWLRVQIFPGKDVMKLDDEKAKEALERWKNRSCSCEI